MKKNNYFESNLITTKISLITREILNYFENHQFSFQTIQKLNYFKSNQMSLFGVFDLQL